MHTIYSPEGFKISSGIFGSTFYMATGFHGFHVMVGTTFLVVCMMRAWYGHFRPDKHVGLEAAAWYWHFVDVVWLFLFAWVYWWGGRLALVGAPAIDRAAPPAALSAGLRCRCPACGQGPLFEGFLKVRQRCPVCGADVSAHDSGDGPVAFIVLIAGGLVVGLALLTEVKYAAAGVAAPRPLAAARGARGPGPDAPVQGDHDRSPVQASTPRFRPAGRINPQLR